MDVKINSIVLVAGVLFLTLVGCGLFGEPRPRVDRPGSQTLDRLEEAYRRGRAGGVVDLLDEEGEIDISDLTSDQRKIFRNRTGIRLDLHSRTYRRPENNRVAHVETAWNLTWRDEQGEIIRRSGRTEFEFQQKNDSWLITSQSGDLLLGNLTPGEKL